MTMIKYSDRYTAYNWSVKQETQDSYSAAHIKNITADKS